MQGLKRWVCNSSGYGNMKLKQVKESLGERLSEPLFVDFTNSLFENGCIEESFFKSF